MDPTRRGLGLFVFFWCFFGSLGFFLFFGFHVCFCWFFNCFVWFSSSTSSRLLLLLLLLSVFIFLVLLLLILVHSDGVCSFGELPFGLTERIFDNFGLNQISLEMVFCFVAMDQRHPHTPVPMPTVVNYAKKT